MVPTRGLLLGVAALLQGFVFGQEETHPGAGGGGGVLAGEQEADQHPRNLVIVQGPAVPGEEEAEEKKHFKAGNYVLNIYSTGQKFSCDVIDSSLTFTTVI